MFRILISLLVFFSLSLYASIPDRIVTVAEANVGGLPESVITDGQFIYASNIGPAGGILKDKDGYISKIALDGTLIEQKFLPREGIIHSPTGMAIIQDTLYVTDVDRVLGFNLQTREQTFLLDFSKEDARFLNDLDVIDSGHLILTATVIKKVFLIDLQQKSYTPLTTTTPWNHPNGVVFDQRTQTVYISENDVHNLGEEGNGNVIALRFDQKENQLETLWSLRLGKFLDGIDLRKGYLLVSDWYTRTGEESKLIAINLLNGTREKDISLQVNGFADFFHDETRDVLLIPHLMVGKISLHEYK